MGWGVRGGRQGVAAAAVHMLMPPAQLKPRPAIPLQPPKRSIVLYGADGQAWPAVVGALKKGLLEDGPVTLVLERRLPPEAAASGPP